MSEELEKLANSLFDNQVINLHFNNSIRFQILGVK